MFAKSKPLLGLVLGAATLATILAWLSTKVPAVHTHGFGWVHRPENIAAIRAALPQPDFAATEAGRAEYSGPEDVFLWDACRHVTGDLLPPRDQGSVGACVGFGTASAIEHLLCVQIAAGQGGTFRDLAPEIIYAGSRHEIGNDAIRGDGSVGAWAARFVHDYGVLPRDRYRNLDLTRYNERLCRSLGRTGVPDHLEPITRQHPVRTIANVRSFDECRAAIRNGYPLIVCSDQGFLLDRDAEGFAIPHGTWMHCFAIVGICGGERPGAFLLNSWGASAHAGPRGRGSPSPAGFWVDAAVVDRMLRQGDSWAFSQVQGFPARPQVRSVLSRLQNPRQFEYPLAGAGISPSCSTAGSVRCAAPSAIGGPTRPGPIATP